MRDSEMDMLAKIVARKRRENERRRPRMERLAARLGPPALGAQPGRVHTLSALRRHPGEPLRFIAEIKRRSPSAGEIRAFRPGMVSDVARAYEAGGASAISVLCDFPGFGGTALDLRRAATVVSVPLLFKEFVLEPMQVDLAARSGASMVLLLVRVLSQGELEALIEVCRVTGLVPVVEAADERELERALSTRAEIVGVNARDLRTFKVDPERAHALVARIPADRIAVHMSGVTTPEDARVVGSGRADAVLVGEALMRDAEPGEALRRFF